MSDAGLQPAVQPLPSQRIKPMVDQALTQLSPTFDRMYAQDGRASIPPEHLLKACLLMALFSVRSERQFCERLEYDCQATVVITIKANNAKPETRSCQGRRENMPLGCRRSGKMSG